MCVFVEFREGIKPLKREGLRYAFLMMLQSNAVMLPSSKDMHSLNLCTLRIFSIQCSYVLFRIFVWQILRYLSSIRTGSLQ